MSIILDGTTGITANSSTVLTNASSIPAANITGSLPAIDGSALTGVGSTDYGAVGTYIVAMITTASFIDANTTVSGSSLKASQWYGTPGGQVLYSFVAMNSYNDSAGYANYFVSLGLSGTWRTLTNIGTGGNTGRSYKALLVRIS